MSKAKRKRKAASSRKTVRGLAKFEREISRSAARNDMAAQLSSILQSPESPLPLQRVTADLASTCLSYFVPPDVLDRRAERMRKRRS
jgi:hypothetical protein